MGVTEGLPGLTSNEYLVLAGTLHGIHAITSRLSPTGSSSGAQVIEGESFKMTIFLTATGKYTGVCLGKELKINGHDRHKVCAPDFSRRANGRQRSAEGV